MSAETEQEEDAGLPSLFHRWIAGDGEALAGILEHFRGPLCELVRGSANWEQVKDREGVEDVFQRLFLKLVGSPASTYQGEAALYGFLANAVRGLLGDLVRAKSSAKRGGRVERCPLDSQAERLASLLPGQRATTTPTCKARLHEMLEALRRGLSILERFVLFEVCIYQQPRAATARAAGLTERRLDRMLGQARLRAQRLLRDCLE